MPVKKGNEGKKATRHKGNEATRERGTKATRHKANTEYSFARAVAGLLSIASLE